MNETLFRLATIFLSLIIPAIVYRLFIKRGRTGREYSTTTGRFVSRHYRFLMVILTALISIYFLEPLLYESLHSFCLQNPFSEFILALVALVADYYILMK